MNIFRKTVRLKKKSIQCESTLALSYSLQQHSIQQFLEGVYILRVQHLVVCSINRVNAFHVVT